MGDKTAFITGITGQDGSLLAELLLDYGYSVHGLVRRSSTSNTERIEHLQNFESDGRLVFHVGDMTDADSLTRALKESQPDEVYNLAAQSHVQISFSTAESTADVNALGTLRLLEAIRTLGLGDKTRFYQASTSELFGSSPPPQNESTPFKPRSPYAISKLFAFWTTVNAREAYGMHSSNGILFNHESPTRGEEFVTRKITKTVAEIQAGLKEILSLGNLDARRDWGHARDYVRGMWEIVQQENADDYVLATGETHSVREFVEAAFREIDVELKWKGSGQEEIGVDASTGIVRVNVDPHFFRPTDVNHLVGDASKARAAFGWEPTVSFEELVGEMVAADCERVQQSQTRINN
ncbi:MAG: GDP-mannose 4,6-dehydratase [Planctomycetaceae bacterium]